jgi:hypothetical protein
MTQRPPTVISATRTVDPPSAPPNGKKRRSEPTAVVVRRMSTIVEATVAELEKRGARFSGGIEELGEALGADSGVRRDQRARQAAGVAQLDDEALVSEHRQPLAPDRPGAAVTQELDVAEIRLDVRLLEPEVDRVDECADLLDNSCSERALARPEDELWAFAEPPELDREVLRHGEDGEHAPRLEVAARTLLVHPNELDLGRLLEQALEVEGAPAQDDRPRQRGAVHESDARALAGVPDHETDEQGDHQRDRHGAIVEEMQLDAWH